MADARRKLNWEEQWKCCLDPETAKAIRDSRAPEGLFYLYISIRVSFMVRILSLSEQPILQISTT